jgi:serine/threonine protein kinase
MLFGNPPYRGLSAKSMYYAIENQKLDLDAVSKQARQLLEHVLVSDPDKRINWSDLYKEPLLFKYTSSVILE